MSPRAGILLPLLLLPCTRTSAQTLDELWTEVGVQSGEGLGASVANVGDVNGDDLEDFLVGVPGFANPATPLQRTGAAFLFLGGENGPEDDPDWTFESTVLSSQCGASVAGLGDVNGDGLDDFAVGCPRWTIPGTGLNGRGAVFVFRGVQGGYEGGDVDLPGDEFWRAEGVQLEENFGQSIAGVGDVDGDGFDDVLIGAQGFETDPAENEEGAVFLWYGAGDLPAGGAGIAGGVPGVGGVATNADYWLEGDFFAARLGNNVSTAGDMNNDDLDDFAVRAEQHVGDLSSGSGHVWVMLGASRTGPDPLLGKGDLADAALSIGGLDEVPNVGIGLAGGVDFDRDGFDELVVGSPRADNPSGQNLTGSVNIYELDTGLCGCIQDTLWSGLIDEPSTRFGDAVAVGDFNGDTLPDLAVGATTASELPGGELTGGVLIYLGRLAGEVGSALPPHPDIELFDTEELDFFGQALAAGRFRSEAQDDLLVGTDLWEPGSTSFPNSLGKAFLFGGEPAPTDTCANPPEEWSYVSDAGQTVWLGYAVATGDFDGDGKGDVAAGAPYSASDGSVLVFRGGVTDPTGQVGLGTTPIWVYTPPVTAPAGSRFGFSVATADVNGDGALDLVVGAPGSISYPSGASNPATYSGGRVYAYHGTAGGALTTAPVWEAASTGPEPTFFGYAVANLGDVGAGDTPGGPDGYADVAVGARGLQESATIPGGWQVPGRVYVWHGSENGVNGGVDGTVANYDWAVEGEQVGDWFGASVASAGDLNGDGWNEIVVGARFWDDTSGYPYAAGRAYVWSGPLSASSTVQTTASAIWTGEGEKKNASFGHAFAAGVDATGDGHPDLVVGSPGFKDYVDGVEFHGRVYVYPGDGTGLGAPPDVLPVVLQRPEPTRAFGSSLTFLEDFDGDGSRELAIGAWGTSSPEPTEGRLFQFEIGPSGVDPNPYWVAESDHVAAALGGGGFSPNVADAGDVDGDGRADLVAGAPFWIEGGDPVGRVLAWYGTNAGSLGVTPNPVAPGDTVTFHYQGGTPGAAMGIALLDTSGVPILPPFHLGIVDADLCTEVTFTVPAVPPGTYSFIAGQLEPGASLVLSEVFELTVL